MAVEPDQMGRRWVTPTDVRVGWWSWVGQGIFLAGRIHQPGLNMEGKQHYLVQDMPETRRKNSLC